MKKMRLIMAGMQCASNIERSMKKFPGKNETSVNLMLKKGSIEIYDNIADEELKKTVKKAVYETKSAEFE